MGGSFSQNLASPSARNAVSLPITPEDIPTGGYADISATSALYAPTPVPKSTEAVSFDSRDVVPESLTQAKPVNVDPTTSKEADTSVTSAFAPPTSQPTSAEAVSVGERDVIPESLTQAKPVDVDPATSVEADTSAASAFAPPTPQPTSTDALSHDSVRDLVSESLAQAKPVIGDSDKTEVRSASAICLLTSAHTCTSLAPDF